jgi:S-adenosylmethionine hydrolase
MARPIITLTTDFGTADTYVGTMKGVLLGLCPHAALIDITHEIRPHAVRQAAYLLSTATPFFPPGTVHLVVVDPGVGSARRAVAVQAGRATFVAPDNGVLTLALAHDPPHLAVALTNPGYHLPQISATFHGRDIFAPAAAHLACGADPRDMGDPFPPANLVRLPSLEPRRRPDGTWLGEVLHVDRFGNLVTNVQGIMPNAQCTVEIAGQRITSLSRTFADVAPGELLIYVGSSGYLEIAVRGGSAATHLGVGVGAPVEVQAR